MSSARGGSARGRARGPGQHARDSASRGPPSTRGKPFNGNAVGRSNAVEGHFGEPVRGRATPARGADRRTQVNSFKRPQTPPGASSKPRSRGSWQERYQALTKARDNERAEAIRRGIIADPDKPRSLADAITPVGTCQDMCSEYERVQRVVQKDVWAEETDPNASAYSSMDREPDEARMVKKFRRSAAGLEEQLPSDLRPPSVLKQTCDYLFNDIVGNAPSLGSVHHFVWDRTRAIRNDFSIQQISKTEDLRIAIDCYERIARFHILSLHQLAVQPKPYDKYDSQQEREQLDRTLLSLMQYYDDCHARLPLPNQAEFRAYCVIFQLQDPTPDLEDRVQSWPTEIMRDSRVQSALRLYSAACNTHDAQGPLKPRAKHLIAQQDWELFWTLVSSKKVSYLMACVAEIYFNLIRRTVLNALWRAFRGNPKVPEQDWTLEVLCELLAFDDENEAFEFCEGYGFSFQDLPDGQGLFLDLTSVRDRDLPTPKVGMNRQSKSMLVENKRLGRSLPSIIDGLTVQQAQNAGLVTYEDLADEMHDMSDHEKPHTAIEDSLDMDTVDDGESLFLPETADTLPHQGNGGASQSVFTAMNTNPFKNPTEQKESANTFGQPSSFGLSSTSANLSSATLPQAPSLSRPAKAGDEKSSILEFATRTGSEDTLGSSHHLTTPLATGSSLPAFTPASFTFTRKPSETSKPFDFGKPGSSASPLNESIGTTAMPPSNNQNRGIFSTGFNWQATPSIAAASTRIEQPTEPSTSIQQDLVQSNSELTPKAPNNTRPAPATHPQVAETTPVEFESAETQQLHPHYTNPPSPLNPTPSFIPSTAPVSAQPLRKASVQDNKPRNPSPLSISFSAEDSTLRFDSVATSTTALEPRETASNQAPSNMSSKPALGRQTRESGGTFSRPTKEIANVNTLPELDFKVVVARIADEILVPRSVGFLDQYVEFAVGQVITEVQEQLQFERANNEAFEFRQFVLKHRYGKRWREIYWRKRLASQGRKRRERAQQRLWEARHQSEAPKEGGKFGDSSIWGGIAAEAIPSGRVIRQKISGEETGNVPGRVARSRRSTDTADTEQQAMIGSKRRSSLHGASGSERSKETGHKRLKSTSNVNGQHDMAKTIAMSTQTTDLLKRSSFLGFSLATDSRHRTSTTKTNHFRLKALGIDPTGDLSTIRGTIRRKWGQMEPEDSASDSKSDELLSWRSSPGLSSDKTPVPPSDPTSKQYDDDEALFTRLAAARARLKENSETIRSEAAKAERIHGSTSIHSTDGFSSKAKWSSTKRDTPTVEGSVPAYHLRESRFVPREHYGRAIERAKEFRESRSRNASPGATARTEAVKSPAASAGPFRLATNPKTQSEEDLLQVTSQQSSREDQDLPGLAFQPPTQLCQTARVATLNPWSSTPQAEPLSLTSLSNSAIIPQARSQEYVGRTDLSKNSGITELAHLVNDVRPKPFKKSANFESQLSFDTAELDPATVMLSPPEGQKDFTIKPPQIEQSLSESFGNSSSFSQVSRAFSPVDFQAAQASASPPQPGFGMQFLNSQTQSQSSPTVQSPVTNQVLSSPPRVGNEAQDHNTGQRSGSYGVWPPPFDSYMNSNTRSDAESAHSRDGDHVSEAGSASQIPVTNGISALHNGDENHRHDGSVDGNSPTAYEHANMYAALARDEEESNSALEEDDSEGMGPDDYGDPDEDDIDGDGEDLEDYDEDDELASEPDDEEGNQVRQRFASTGANPAVWRQLPAKNETLQTVGGTQEEAIELSD